VNSERIYLDNAATTPVRAEVAQAMHAASDDGNYNPSSLHAEGRRARALLDAARERAASILGASRSEITFTSSGTEADNLALLGVLHAAAPRSHIVTTAIEHHAVLSAVERLREEGYDTTVLPVGADGKIAPADFAAALRPSTVLASVMYANNEIGSIQPIAELAAIARQRGVLFHSDAVQAPSWLPVDVRSLGVDLLSLSAHKCYGPKGSGLLYVRRGVPLVPVTFGGGQEFGRRSGTPNVVGAIGLARALELASRERPGTAARVAGLRDRLEMGICAGVPDVRVNGALVSRLPNNLSTSFAGVESAAMLIRLDLSGIAVSAGSACTSGSLEPSHVLAAIGLGDHWQRGTIRFSLGRQTTRDEIDCVVAEVPRIVAELRSPAVPVASNAELTEAESKGHLRGDG
jgi:cysteine desulfurase